MNTERERFEGWLKGCGYIDRDLDTDHRGVYVASMVRIQWNAWQSARAWRPIETAPRDGTLILITDPNDAWPKPQVSAAFYNSCDDEFPWWFIDPEPGEKEREQINGRKDDPRLLWRPLPEPPEQTP